MNEEIEQEGDPTLLTFGSIMAIADFQDQNAFVYSDGFLKTNILLKNFVKRSPNSKLKNNSFYHCLFQVLPKVSDTTKTLVLKKLHSMDKKQPQVVLMDDEKYEHMNRFKFPNRELNETLFSLMNEYKYNLDTFEKAKRCRLSYNQPFQLMHVASGRLLACHESESRYENQNYLLKLDDYSSEATVFTVVPAFRYQKDGEQEVIAGEMCAITRANPICNKTTYVHCSAQEISELKQTRMEQPSEQFTIYKREVNASVEEAHSWKVVLFEHYIPETTRFLKVGGCLWLHHSEADSVLAVRRKLLAVDKYNFTSIELTKWLDLDNSEVTVLSSVGSQSADSYEGSTSGLWQLEGSDFTVGGYIQFDKGYRLRNLSMGYYLQVIQQNNEFIFALTDSASDKSTLFEFVELKTLTQDKYVKSGSYVYLKHQQHRKWIDFNSTQHDYKAILKGELEQTEHAVFKIQVPSKNAIWEINFLLSCFRMLAKFLIQIQQESFPGVARLTEKQHYLHHFVEVKQCIQDLDDFVNNRQYNTSIEQSYGHINTYRQKLLKEQFYIDILVKILGRIILKAELELLEPVPIEFGDDHQTTSQKQILAYVTSKVDLCTQIYKFLGSVCKHNPDNQLYTFELIPYFQLQTKYISSAIDTIIEVVCSNRVLLYRLSEGLKIDFDFKNSKELVEDHKKRIKVLINLYESENELTSPHNIQFKQHEKINSKPINLISYFINLIWDDEAHNNADYLRFLLSVCRYQDAAINVNQENIYKLYKKYNDVRPKLGVETKAESTKQSDGTVRLMSKAGQLIIPAECDNSTGKKQFSYIIEQLTFFSEVAYGRNYLWKKELGAQFEKSFLFRNIWNPRPMDFRYEHIKPCFLKIATNLYINQDPLQERSVPVFCRLFGECDVAQDFKLFKNTIDDSQNVQELNTYNDLVINLMNYLRTLREHVKEEIENEQNKEDIGNDLLQNELIFNSTKLVHLLIKLDLFQVLEYSYDAAVSTKKLYSQLIEILLYLFQYEKFELKFVQAHVLTLNDNVQKQKNVKVLKNQLVPIGMSNLNPFGFLSSKDEEDTEQHKGDVESGNEQALYVNPMMRGFIKFANKLHSYNYMDQKYIRNEINAKVHICDIYERLLDARQDFLLQNTLVFFKHYVVGGLHEENDEQAMSRRLEVENKQRTIQVHYRDLTRHEKDAMIIERLLATHQVGLLCNIARTGIKEVDYPKPIQSKNAFDALADMKKLFQDKKTRGFHNYIAELNVPGIPEIHDFDHYLSLQLDVFQNIIIQFIQDPNPNEKPIGSMFPTLLNSFMLITDPTLEKRCIGVIMRLFNQQEEYKNNLHKMQVIFDSQKTLLYKFVHANLKNLTRNVERIEIWFTNFQKGYSEVSEELQQCLHVLQNLNSGLHVNITQDANMNIVAQSPHEIDGEKQTLLANLCVYQPIVNFLRDGMHYFHDMILEPDVSLAMKHQMITTFSAAFEFLRNLCANNHNIQLTMYGDMQFFTNYLQYDLGQVKLLVEIFKNNNFLLVQKIDLTAIQLFSDLIEREGRQEHFLDFYEHAMLFKNKYIFDNQIMVLNNILTSELNDRCIKLLYADGMKDKDIKFYLDDAVYIHDDGFLKKLEDVQFKDTFRDEPFRYHRRILDILVQTTMNSVDKRAFKPFLSTDVAKENFNINVGKIKKFFNAAYLLDLLIEDDHFVGSYLDDVDQHHYDLQPDQMVLDEQLRQSNMIIRLRREGFSLLKPQVIEFLRLIFITSERGSVQNSELYNCQGKVKTLFDFELKRLESLKTITSAYVVYCFEGLIPFAISYHQRFSKSNNDTRQIDEDRKDVLAIDRYAKLLFAKMMKQSPYLSQLVETQYEAQCLRQLHQCYPISQYEAILLQLQGASEGDLRLAHKLDRLERGHNEIEFAPPQSELVVLDHDSSGSDESDLLMSRKKQEKVIVQAAAHHDAKSEAKVIEDLWSKFLAQVVGNKHFQAHQNKERETIANGIINIQKLLNPTFSKLVAIKPDVKMVSKKLILYLQSAFSDPQCTQTIDTLLKILQKIIEKENEKDKKSEMQNLFDKLGATQMVLLVLSEQSRNLDKKMLMNFLIFMNCLLQGGNPVVQLTIHGYMRSFPQSEMIFQKVYGILRKQIENVEITHRHKVTKKGGLDVGMLSLDDREALQDKNLVTQVLQFMQNAVEGHFLPLQDYLRYQTNSRNNYDLIIAVTELFKTYYYDGCTRANYDHMIKCLDTLNELVQGPCPDNQIAVSESKFFDIALDIFSRAKNATHDEEDLEDWMIVRLQNKVLMLVLSLLENREINNTNQVLKRIMRNLPLTLLEKHCAKAYKNYAKIYGKNNYTQKCLDHLSVDPRDLTPMQFKDYHKKHFKCVLQNGFLLYFLISYYIQCDPSIESPVVSMHKAYVKSVLKIDKDNIAAVMFEESLPGQLFHFVKELFYSLMSVGNSMRNIAQNQLNKITSHDVVSDEVRDRLKVEHNRLVLKDAVSFYIHNSAHIDVVYRDHLEIVFFILLPLTKHLPKDKKNIFQEEVDRNTTQTKVQGLVDEADNLIEICKHEENLFLIFKKQKFLALFTNYVKLWQESAFYLTLFLNIFILFSFDATWGDRLMGYVFFNDTSQYNNAETEKLIVAVGVGMTCCSVFVVTYYLMKNAPIIIKRSWNQKGLFKGQTNIIFWLLDILYKLTMVILSFLQEIEVMYYIAYGIFAILGTVIHPFFFVFHLSLILFRYPTLKNIILSVWQPRAQLVLTIFLFVILIYYFTLVAYSFIADQYSNDCDVLLYCLLLNMDQTFKSSIGNYICSYDGQLNTAEKFGVGRFFFDNVSNIILGLIMLSIVAGIIIDTFGSLREQDHNKKEDIESKCFICGNLKATFDRSQLQNSGGFRQHIKLNHYMWDYLFFIAYLQWKNKTDYSGIESFVNLKLQEDDLCWVPFNKARELDALETTDGQGDQEMLEEMQKRVENVQDKLKEMARILKINYKHK